MEWMLHHAVLRVFFLAANSLGQASDLRSGCVVLLVCLQGSLGRLKERYGGENIFKVKVNISIISSPEPFGELIL